MKKNLSTVLFFLTFFFFSCSEKKKPNIIWLVCEDQSQIFFPMYGDNTVDLPNLKALAEDSVVFENMHATTPVCSPARSAIITGMYPTTLGTHNMRAYNEGRATNQPQLNIPSYSPSFPDHIKPFTTYLRNQGYFCINNNKEDYNFKISKDAWNQSCSYCSGTMKENIHWRNRLPNQPFFAVLNFQITHEAQIWKQSENKLYVDPNQLNVPKFFPDNDIIRKDLAVNYSNLVRMDNELGLRIQELKDKGLYEDAYIFFYSDHGGPFPRFKRAIYDTGVKVPFMVKYPKSKWAKTRVDELLSFVDLAPTVLDIAGIEIPNHLQGFSFLDFYKFNRNYLITASDRFDEEVDRIRSIKTKKFKLIKNFYLEKAHALPVRYRENMPLMKELNKQFMENTLNNDQIKWFQSPKQEFELYDLEKDPNELENLSGIPEYSSVVDALNQELDKWIIDTNDLGEFPESFTINNSKID
ncbi:MAG: sulfatase [Bacteroidetes bacterium]|nr:sulfatase [Bacteroidota bacterium]MDA0888677.1 sulfatase [Bacteroidota bacterium]MDA1085315.1 sulfatase [Bacteroidota bacterium]